MAVDVDLVPVTPFYRLNWPDGTNFDYSNDEAALRAEIAKLDPADIAGYERFLDYSRGVYDEGYVKLGSVAFLDFAAMLRAAPALAKYQAWRSVYSIVSSYVKDERLRQALSFHTLLVGGNPMTTSSIYALIHTIEKDGGVWFARGGTNALVAAMVRLFERLGGVLRLGDPVARIETRGDRATGVTTAGGWRGAADMVACNGDLMHSYRDLLDHSRGAKVAKSLARKRWSPSLFVVHFGAKGDYPGVAHHSILFGPRYKGLLDDIYGGRVPDDFSLYLHHPSITDPGMAPRPFDFLRACPRRASRQGEGRLGRRFRRAFRRRDPGRGRAPRRARPPRQSRHAFSLYARRFWPRSVGASWQRLQPRTRAMAERVVSRP